MARILIAEDDRHILRVLSLWICRNGHEVLLAEDGLEALALLRKHRPDLLITDVNMPGLGGIELLERARSEGLTDRQAIVLTSRCDQHEMETQAARLGAVVHPKPFSPQHLMGAIESALRKSVSAPESSTLSDPLAGVALGPAPTESRTGPGE
jgi:DNA-binding response OmpR family regulator